MLLTPLPLPPTQGKFLSKPHALHFAESLSHILNLWTALRLIADHQPAGSQTNHLIHTLHSHTFDFFHETGEGVEPWELEDNLVGYFEEVFGVGLEDGSAGLVSKELVRLFKETGRGELSGLEKLRVAVERVKERWATTTTTPANLDDDSDDDDSDDDSSMMSDDGSNDSDYPVDAEDAAMRDAEPEKVEAKLEPVIDEDGFELVQKVGRRKRR
ncbi:hypothetical protein HDV05_002200 [Chytridiales sp. JEL 0842]|nr:hypothetical protein HDV05_002200 [Chytridiales sp. JEL 0842]